MRESQVLSGALRFLTLHPYCAMVWRNNVGRSNMGTAEHPRWVSFGIAGSSDLLGITRSGQFIAVETKALGKKPTPAQADFLDQIAAAGGFAWWGWDLEGLVRAFDSYIERQRHAQLVLGLAS